MRTPSDINNVIIPLSHCFMRYRTFPNAILTRNGNFQVPSQYMDTIDYSQVCDACLDDLKEGKYL